MASDQAKVPTSWSADGRFLLYHSIDPQTNGDLWVVPMVGDRTPSVFLKTPFREAFGAFSPDGRWVAYQSNESGRSEIYVRPFVAPGAAGTAAAAAGGQWQVSTAGGIVPVWRPDGKELYYLNPAGAMMAAPITVTGATLEPGAPVVLFPTRIVGGGADVQQGRHYDVAPDGRFLINTELDSADAPITLLQNWNPEATKVTLTPGTRLGAYEITAQIGVGGMGEVYRATDTKLEASGRDEDPAGIARGGPRAPRAVPARSGSPRVAESSEHRGDLRARGEPAACRRS